MGLTKRVKCRHCKRFFKPDHRNGNRQKYCKAPECRKASKVASQQKWLQKPENENYFTGHINTKRVQDWRKQNPDYWKRSCLSDHALQDRLKPNLLKYIRVMSILKTLRYKIS
jgi:hypothetical protein